MPFSRHLPGSLPLQCTIGYGDIIPVTNSERFYLIFELMIGTSLFSYVIGTVVGTINLLNAKTAAFSHVSLFVVVYPSLLGGLGALKRSFPRIVGSPS